MAVGGIQQDSGHGLGAVVLVEDPDLEVGQLDVGDVRMLLGDRIAEGAVERVDRAVALGGADVAGLADPELDRRLGLDPAVGALLGDDAEALQPEQRLVAARLTAQQQLERRVGGLVVVAAVLAVLEPLDGASRRRRRGRCRLRSARASTEPRPASSEISTSRRFPTSSGSMCSNVRASVLTAA